jgi:hypothetical protein
VTGSDGVDTEDIPTPLVAVAMKVTGVPFARLRTLHVVVALSQY